MTGLFVPTGTAIAAAFQPSGPAQRTAPWIPDTPTPESLELSFTRLLGVLFEPAAEEVSEDSDPEQLFAVTERMEGDVPSPAAFEAVPGIAASPHQIAAAVIRSMLAPVVRGEEREPSEREADDTVPEIECAVPNLSLPARPVSPVTPERVFPEEPAPTPEPREPEANSSVPAVAIPPSITPTREPLPESPRIPVQQPESIPVAKAAVEATGPRPTHPVRESFPELPVAFTVRLTPNSTPVPRRPAASPSAPQTPATKTVAFPLPSAGPALDVVPPASPAVGPEEQSSESYEDRGAELEALPQEPPHAPSDRTKLDLPEKPAPERGGRPVEVSPAVKEPVDVQPLRTPPAQVAVETLPGPNSPAPSKPPEGVTASQPVEPPMPLVNPRHAPARELAVRISDSDGAPVDLRIAERGGTVRVAVRTGVGDLQHNLRQELPVLIERLEGSGFHAQASIPEQPGITPLREDALVPGIEGTPVLKTFPAFAEAGPDTNAEAGHKQHADPRDPQQQRRQHSSAQDRWQDFLEEHE